MKTSNKGKFAITTNLNGNSYVIFEPVNGTIWMHKAELSELFGVYQQTINACLDSIFKTKTFRAEEVCEYDLVVRGSKVRYDMCSFRLEVIIALAFRLYSPNAEIIRQWVISRLLNSGLTNLHLVNIQGYSLN